MSTQTQIQQQQIAAEVAAKTMIKI